MRRTPRAKLPDAAGAASRIRVAIVGRPNVGKSTLFNRLLGRRRSITLDEPGITRDPIVEPAEMDELVIDLVDTGGLKGEADILLADRVHEHTLRAIAASDLVVLLFDAKAGVVPLDRETVDLVKKSGRPAIYVANKGEGRAGEERALEFCELGIDMPLLVAAEHGIGLGELRVEIEKEARAILQARGIDPDAEPAEVEAAEASGADGSDERERSPDLPCRVAIVGRPNVGKSSLLNLLAGETLSLVDNKPGTTRDIVDTTIERNGRRYLLVDTAGMRRPSRVDEGVERISVRRALEAIERADIVVLLVEPEEGMTDQDARIARHAWSEGRALVLLINKCDLASGSDLERVERNFRDVYPTLSPVPVGRLSVLEKRGVDEAFRLIDHAAASHTRHLSTSEVNEILEDARSRREPPVMGTGRLRVFYGTQTAERPPTISIFTNRSDLPEEYQRFLERCFREGADFTGTPLRLRFVRRSSHGRRDEPRSPAR